MTRTFDVIVIGAGPAGEVAAGRLAAAGLEVAIVEDRLVGGECSYWACMPSKALLRPGEALDEVGRIPGAADAIGGELAVQAVLDRRDEVVHDLDDAAQLPWLEDQGITLVRGRARFTGEKQVVVGDDDELEARRAVIVSIGSCPAIPDVEGLQAAKPWTNRDATVSPVVPGRLLVLGGGVVGAEMAQAYSSLGSQVTLVEGGPHILSKEEPWAGEQVQDALRGNGVDVRVQAKVARVERPQEGGEVTLHFDDGSSVAGDELLVAVGRTIRTDRLALETIGVEAGEHGYLTVDDQMRVEGKDWLWAVGDVNGRALLTHMGKHQARVVGDLILGKEARLWERGDGKGSPRVTFTEPQVAAVGLTKAAAEESGIDVQVVQVGTSANAGGSFWGRDATGTAQLVIDRGRSVVVGATFTGAEVQDMLQAATFAVVGELTLDTLWHGIAPFPTRSEIWLNLLQEAGL